jgi:hypothetical protein
LSNESFVIEEGVKTQAARDAVRRRAAVAQMAWAETWASWPSGYDGSIRKQRVPDAAGLSANNAEKIPCSRAKLSCYGAKYLCSGENHR